MSLKQGDIIIVSPSLSIISKYDYKDQSAGYRDTNRTE